MLSSLNSFVSISTVYFNTVNQFRHDIMISWRLTPESSSDGTLTASFRLCLTAWTSILFARESGGCKLRLLASLHPRGHASTFVMSHQKSFLRSVSPSYLNLWENDFMNPKILEANNHNEIKGNISEIN